MRFFRKGLMFKQMSDSEFFPRFKWAIPRAFSEAIANCYFIQGDTLYDTQLAYSRWDIALQHIKYCIQILDPSQKNFNSFSFYKNWFSQVRLVFYKYANSQIASKDFINTTQGRVFTMLWKGDLEILNNNTPEPQPPLFIQNAKYFLREFELIFKDRINNQYVQFVMPYDSTSDLAKEKDFKIKSALRKEFNFQTTDIFPEEAGTRICKVFQFSPTISFKCYGMYTDKTTIVESTIKKALYKKQNAKKQNAQDRFDIKRHGILIVPGKG